MSTRSIACAVVLLATAGEAAATVSGTAAVTSDYVFRGVSQGNRDPAFQAGFEWAQAGFYAGTWGSSISWLSDLSTDAAKIASSLEFDVYAGYRGMLGDDVAFDVGTIYYWYPGEYPSGFNDADTAELYGALSFGVFTAKYSYAVTDFIGYADSDGSGYLDLAANVPFAETWTLNLHAGKQWIESNEDFECLDWKVGVTKAFDHGFSLAAAWVDTDADDALYTNPHGTRIADAAATLTLTKAF